MDFSPQDWPGNETFRTERISRSQIFRWHWPVLPSVTWRFAPQDVSLPAWTLRLLDILPLDGSSPWRFAPWTIRHLDDSPHTCGRFAPCLDVSPPGRFAPGWFAAWTIRPIHVDVSPPDDSTLAMVPSRWSYSKLFLSFVQHIWYCAIHVYRNWISAKSYVKSYMLKAFSLFMYRSCC